MFIRFAVRDIGILVATIALWVSTFYAPSGTPLGRGVGILAGLGAAVCAYNLHEWGHVLGARLSHSVYTPARRLISPFLFAYSAEENTRNQFLVMSLAGFVATGVFVVAYWIWMPQDQLAGRVALRGALILASLTVIIEFPIFFLALFGKKVPKTGLFDGPTVGGRKGPSSDPR